MATRLDISNIQPLGAYAAKQCPVRVQLDVLRPCEPADTTEFDVFLHDAGNRFEANLVESLESDRPGDWVLVPTVHRTERERLTIAAIERRAPVIINGRLPCDEAGRRVGEPDLLVWAEDGYVPVDVKHHRTLDVESDDVVAISEVGEPFPVAAQRIAGALRKRRGDALQLAHYRRMLQSHGWAASRAVAGIIGTELVVVWYDLDAPLWRTPAKSDGVRRKMRSTMEVYDFEFDFRCDIAAAALGHLADSSTEPLVEPMRSAECSGCPWRSHCGPILEAGAGDTSLLPKVRYAGWRALRDLGIRNRSQARSLDLVTAQLAADGVDVARWLDISATAEADAPLETLWSRPKAQLETLAAADIRTAGEVVDKLDRRTAQLNGTWVPEAIIGAHAALGDHAVYRRPGITAVAVPRADVEIDVDMENSFDGVYLWGVYVTDRRATGMVEPGYRSFATWEPLATDTERVVFDDFWEWLRTTLDDCDRNGFTVRTYVWHEPAENYQLKRVSRDDLGLRTEVDALIASDTWVDLRQVFLTQLTTGGSTGLKAIAPLAGFEWDVDDPGGAMSMVYHGYATGDDAELAERHRCWLLDYNRGDVMATARIREWMADTSFPELDVTQVSAA